MMMNTRKIQQVIEYLQNMGDSQDADYAAAEYLAGMVEESPADYHELCAFVGTDATEDLDRVAAFIRSDYYAPFMAAKSEAEDRMYSRADGVEDYDIPEMGLSWFSIAV